ncbi:MAG: hypothetical protein QOD39_5019, partial [Mycobacterium sp.]|nr:hypothetical protein [Mycobacterium sp.]
MTTIYKNRTGRRGRTMAAITLAVGATVAGIIAPATANAADQYIAVALGYVNENPPVTMAGGSAISSDQTQAGQNALTDCVNNGGSQCVTEVITTECAAAASNNYGEEVGASAATRGAAESAALGKLQNQTGAKIIVSGCANGSSTPPPPNDPPPPPAPKQGPTVSFDTVLGGMVAHITDRSGVSSQCTYATDNFNRG